MTKCDVVIIGAGPYGLSAGNQLRRIRGLDVRVFGEPMWFWKSAMPAGMFLRSNWTATQIADPDNLLTLENYVAECGNHLSVPVPVARFVQYGEWYQRKSLPDVDRRTIDRLQLDRGGFRLILQDGEQLVSRCVVIAAGIGSFAYRPPEFDNLPCTLVSHTSEHSDLGKFAGKDALVLGGGQSAFESAALLHENGALVEVVARSHRVHWLQGWASRTLHHGLGRLTRRLLYAPTDVGPAGVSQLMARPDLLRRLPRRLQDRLRKRSVRPAGARWLVERVRDIPVRLGCTVASASVSGQRVHVRFDDGTERAFDHVLLATGYRVDISRYRFLAPELLASLRVFNGFPVLREGLESSVSGLHFLGAPGVWSFGPILMFVSGTRYASAALARSIHASAAR